MNLQYACDEILKTLRHRTYVDNRYVARGIKHPKIIPDFRMGLLPSKHDKEVDTLHIVCFDTETNSYIYLCEVYPNTARWVVEDSSFYEKTVAFGTHCIELLESEIIGEEELTSVETGNHLLMIVKREFPIYLSCKSHDLI